MRFFNKIIEYLDVLKQFAPQLKEKYLEYIVTEKKNAEERFFNQLAMHYINKIKDAKKNQEPKDSKKIIDVKEIKKNLDYKELGGSKSNLDGSYETDVKVYKKAEIDYRFKFSRLFEIAPKNL